MSSLRYAKSHLFSDRYQNLSIGLILLGLVVSLVTLDQYGATVDETFVRQRSNHYSRYLFYLLNNRTFIPLFEYFDQNNIKAHIPLFYYGGFLPLIQTGIGKLLLDGLGLSAYVAYHVPLVIIFYVSLLPFFGLGKRLLGSRGAFIATILLLCYPRIFHHAHNNPKDVSVMAFVIFGAYFLVRAIEESRKLWAILAGFCFAVAVSTKIDSALIVVGMGIGWLFYEFYQNRSFIHLFSWKTKKTQTLGAFVFCMPFFYYSLWPTVWGYPEGLQEALTFFTGKRMFTQGTYFGEYLTSYQFPWHYTPVNLLVATPLITLIGFVVGIFTFNAKRNGVKKLTPWYLFLLLWFLLPISVRLLPGSPTYNNIRHIMPSIPALILISAYGLNMVVSQLTSRYSGFPALRSGVIGIIVFSLLAEMIAFFPFGNAYFNEPTRRVLGSNVHKYFDTDYWSSSYLQGLQWLNENTSGKLKVCVPYDRHTTWSYEKRAGIKMTCDNYDVFMIYGGRILAIESSNKFKKKYKPENTTLMHTISRSGVEVMRIYRKKK